MSDEPRLLVVDDEDAICEGCSRIFSRQGFDVRKCSDANQGLSLATQTDYSAILLDIKMPTMDGIQFLEALRKQKPTVPVVLMTGYPSIPNAASAIRLGASDYVTKPFTPEEISQAVHRLLHENQGAVVAEKTSAVEAPAVQPEFRFWHDAWYQAGKDGVARVGAIAVRPGVAKVESVRLPRIGEVVYQGLPLAAVTVAGQPERIIPAPLSGIVVGVNESLGQDPAALLTDPCGEGWIACVSATRLDEETENCQLRRVMLLNPNQESAKEQIAKLTWLGCEVRAITTLEEVETVGKSFDSNVVLVDGTSLGLEGPGIVGAINTMSPTTRTIVLGSTDSLFEAAYRIRRIFYYAVEPFADNEIADILAAAFQPPAKASGPQYRELAQALGSILVTNQNRTRVRLVAAPGMLRREQGLGELLRHKLMQRRFPIESSPVESDLTPLNLLGMASKCDRLIVLLVQDTGRLPGSMVRDTKAEFVAVAGKGADKVTTLIVQPSGFEADPLKFDPVTLDALAEQLTREMATC